MVSWLFLVLILNSSYTASLSSMLTIQRLQPNVTDILCLKKYNMKIGCDGDSFVRTYLEKVEQFKPENIINMDNEYSYEDAFKNNSIAAAFLELPYEKVYMSKYCKGYSASVPTTKFGGLGFVSNTRILRKTMIICRTNCFLQGNRTKRHSYNVIASSVVCRLYKKQINRLV